MPMVRRQDSTTEQSGVTRSEPAGWLDWVTLSTSQDLTPREVEVAAMTTSVRIK